MRRLVARVSGALLPQIDRAPTNIQRRLKISPHNVPEEWFGVDDEAVAERAPPLPNDDPPFFPEDDGYQHSVTSSTTTTSHCGDVLMALGVSKSHRASTKHHTTVDAAHDVVDADPELDDDVTAALNDVPLSSGIVHSGEEKDDLFDDASFDVAEESDADAAKRASSFFRAIPAAYGASQITTKEDTEITELEKVGLTLTSQQKYPTR
jgi:hypothetical protein